MQQEQIKLDASLFRFSNEPDSEGLTVGDSHTSILVTGSTGSGKSSGSATHIARGYLKNNFGGIVFSVKSELAFWEKICRETGRLNDLVVVGLNRGNHFNWMEYISTNKGTANYSDNIYRTIKEVVSSGEVNNESNKDPFWELSLSRLLINTIDLCLLAFNKINVQLLYDISSNAPKPAERTNDAKEPKAKAPTPFDLAMQAASANVKVMVDRWKAGRTQAWLRSVTQEQYEEEMAKCVPEFRTIRMVNEFFSKSFYEINPKTRTLILFTLGTFLEGLLREPFYTLFATNTTFTPKDILNGKIILIDLPILEYDAVARSVQLMLKYVCQQAFQKRDIEDNSRSVFIFSDESQHLITARDAEFIATSRAKFVSVCYITQCLSNYYMFLGGHSEHQVKAFLASVNCKLFHGNTDVDTNQWASALIGEDYAEDISRSVQLGGDFSMSNSTSFKLEPRINPIRFQSLKTGGAKNNFQVHAIIHMLDKKLKNGNYQIICFNQNKI